MAKVVLIICVIYINGFVHITGLLVGYCPGLLQKTSDAVYLTNYTYFQAAENFG